MVALHPFASEWFLSSTPECASQLMQTGAMRYTLRTLSLKYFFCLPSMLLFGPAWHCIKLHQFECIRRIPYMHPVLIVRRGNVAGIQLWQAQPHAFRWTGEWHSQLLC